MGTWYWVSKIHGHVIILSIDWFIESKTLPNIYRLRYNMLRFQFPCFFEKNCSDGFLSRMSPSFVPPARFKKPQLVNGINQCPKIKQGTKHTSHNVKSCEQCTIQIGYTSDIQSSILTSINPLLWRRNTSFSFWSEIPWYIFRKDVCRTLKNVSAVQTKTQTTSAIDEVDLFELLGPGKSAGKLKRSFQGNFACE